MLGSAHACSADVPRRRHDVITIDSEPPPAPALVTAAFRAALDKARGAPRAGLEARDPAFIDTIRPLLGWWYDFYFRCETELSEELPEGPSLVVGNHNGMSTTPDTLCHMVAFWRRYGSQRPSFGLAHDLAFRTRPLASWLGAVGALPASHRSARAALDRGAPVLVFPGGDLEACRPYWRRKQIDFAGRRGFARLALRAQVPIVPLVSAGAHESLLLLSDGREVAKALGFPRRFRSKTFPVALALPWGLVLGVPLAHLPLPVKIHSRFLPALRFDMPPSAADDHDAVEHVATTVIAAMQRGLDDLGRIGRHGLWPRAQTVQSEPPSKVAP